MHPHGHQIVHGVVIAGDGREDLADFGLFQPFGYGLETEMRRLVVLSR